MKKELDSFPAWGTDTALYIICDNEKEIYGQFGGIQSSYAKLYNEQLINTLVDLKVDRNEHWFTDKEEVIEYLEEIQEEHNEHSNPSN